MIDGNEVSLDSTKTTLAATDDVTVWDVFNYNLINLDAGEHTVKVLNEQKTYHMHQILTMLNLTLKK